MQICAMLHVFALFCISEARQAYTQNQLHAIAHGEMARYVLYRYAASRIPVHHLPYSPCGLDGSCSARRTAAAAAKAPRGSAMHSKWESGWSNRAHDGAAQKGYRAGMAGLPASDCPYPDHRRPDGRVTGSRGFRHAWFEGHRAGAQARPDAADGSS
jgi:ribosome modulation factor